MKNTKMYLLLKHLCEQTFVHRVCLNKGIAEGLLEIYSKDKVYEWSIVEMKIIDRIDYNIERL